MNIKGLIFDFDLTLADSSAGIVKCVNYALSEMNYKIPDDYTIKRTIGIKLEETFKTLTGNDNINNIDQFKKLFVSEADRIMSDHTFIFNEAYETIDYLKNKKLKLGIVSTKFRYRIENILKKEKLSGYFDVIIGAEDCAIHKPHPEGLLKALEILALSPEEIFYIGDSLTDQTTACNAKVKFIACLTGCTKKEEFDNTSVYKFINKLDELKIFNFFS